MVLAARVGRKRGFWTGLVLTVLTFGIYAVYWHYKAHNELYRQFELNRESRDEGMTWYVLGLVVPPFLLAYLWVFADNVAYLRQRMGLPQRLGAARFLALLGSAAIVLVAGLVGAEVALAAAGVGDPAVMAWPSGALVLVALLAAAGLAGRAYAMLQRDVNDLWDAYDARLLQLLAEAPQEAPAPAAPAPPVASAPIAPPRATSARAVATLVVGILALLVAWVPYINLLAIVLGLTAILLGIAEVRRARRDPTRAGGRGLATAGLVLGAVSLVVALLVGAAVLVLLGAP